MTIDEEFECLGYFGFGNGISIARDTGKAYCNGCPKSAACWELHKDRVRQLFPALAEHVENLAKEKNGNAKVAKFMQEHPGGEPFLATMTGNMQDGMMVEKVGHVKERGEMTLPYPFKEDK